MAVKGSSAQGKKSREKGVAFEREMAIAFTSWWGSAVRRMPLSGAYGAEWNLAGDLMFVTPFPFYVELKKRENWSLAHLMHEERGPVPGWWRTASAEALLAGQRPLLIVARNRREPLVLFRGRDVRDMPCVNKSGLPRLVRRNWVVQGGGAEDDVQIFQLSVLLAPWTLEAFRALDTLSTQHRELDFA